MKVAKGGDYQVVSAVAGSSRRRSIVYKPRSPLAVLASRSFKTLCLIVVLFLSVSLAFEVSTMSSEGARQSGQHHARRMLSVADEGIYWRGSTSHAWGRHGQHQGRRSHHRRH